MILSVFLAALAAQAVVEATIVGHNSVKGKKFGINRVYDGGLDTEFKAGQMFQSKAKVDAWAEFYFSKAEEITKVSILNRNKMHKRSETLEVHICEGRLGQGCQYCGTFPHKKSYAGEWIDVTCSTPLTGNTLRLFNPSKQLQLVELTCEGTDPEACVFDVTVESSDTTSFVATTIDPPIKTTKAPIITEAPTTRAPTTEAPTTQAPTTEAPTTKAPTTTEAPTTKAPTTTEAPTTEPPTTLLTSRLNMF
jgi:hypothetical protein